MLRLVIVECTSYVFWHLFLGQLLYIKYIVNYIYPSFNPQNLRNTIKKVAKISITQIIIIELVCQNNRILLFSLTSHKFYTFRLVVDINIIA